MATRRCSVPDCDRPHVARGWCRKHYDRWMRRGGDPGEWEITRTGTVSSAVLDLLQVDGGWWTSAGIALRLDTGATAVRKALHRLKDRGLVMSECRQGRWEWRKTR